MANARFWDPVLLGDLSLSELFDMSNGLNIEADDPFDFRGTTYEDIIYLNWNEPDFLRSFELYGNDLDITESGVSGTVTALANFFLVPEQDWVYSAFVDDFSIRASTILSAMLSQSTDDDIAVYRTIFAGNDRVTLSVGDDAFFSGAGRDTVIGNAGNDTIAGNAGDDVLRGNTGRDSLTGGAGDDTQIGGDGRDTITGGGGDDKLVGGSRNNQVDHFVFGRNDGTDRIMDFDNGADRLVITSGADRFADLTITATQNGTEVAFADTIFLIRGVGIAAITAADFDFA